jgi:putative PIG3 family NAD(P)H quinone oxidoreductase
MNAVLINGFGGVETLGVGEAMSPEPGRGQVLVKVMATSINRADLLQREGKYPPPSGDSNILGLEVAGIIEKVGNGVTGWAKGERVMSLVGGGGYAEYAVAEVSHLMRIPPIMSFTEAACVCEAYITAFLNIFMIGGLEDGNTVIIHGGGGGVNTAGIQLCKLLLRNARVIVTASPGKIERVRNLGADLVINYYETPDFSEIVKEYTDMKGADVILDHVGAKYLQPNMTSLGYGGRLVIIGVISGGNAEINLARMMVRRQRIIGSVLRSRPVQEKGDIVAEFSRTVLPKFADRTIIPVIERVFPIDRVADAHRMMEERRHFGKIVLKIAGS